MLYGGDGSDLLVGQMGQDVLFGGSARDELQGGDGNDLLYGEQDNDNLFGQVGDDVLYGGDGDDYLQGFTASNEAQQALLAGQSDNDWLYGGAGSDTLVGSWGRDYLDGGAGADVLVGGQGDDMYIVNSVNDSIYEQSGQGYDVVLSSTNYLLNAHIEELQLLEGFDIHGTGNALDNRIVGNSANNILDGISGADTLIGGQGNDTYYVDNLGDVLIENAGEGIDSVQSSISLQLGEHLENLVLLDFSKAEQGLVDGRSVLVYGYPKRNELDYIQGDAVHNFLGTCALTSIANLLTQTGRPTTEAQVVRLAIDNNWAVNDLSLPEHQLGGSNVYDQQAILNSYGINNDVIQGYNELGMAHLLRAGRGIILAVDAGVLWDDGAYAGGLAVNHVVTLTGAVFDQQTEQLLGFYIADSGRGKVSDMTRFVDVQTLRNAADVMGAYAIYTVEPVKFWQEQISATGNALDNSLVGNRAGNTLEGLQGNDTLLGLAGEDILIGGSGNDALDGGTGNDTYRFGVGDGNDTIDDEAGNDTLLMGPGIDQAQVQSQVLNGQLVLSLGSESISMSARAGKLLEQIRFQDGTTWHARSDGQGYNALLDGQVWIEGQLQQGQRLSAQHSLKDPDGIASVAYQWQRSSDGLEWSALGQGSSASIELTEQEVGSMLRVLLTSTDKRGNVQSLSSAASAAVLNLNDAPSGSVTISGSALVGSTLVATHSLLDADGLGSLSYQWLANGQSIAGANASTLTVQKALKGQTLSVQVSYTDGHGSAERVSSQSTQAVSEQALVQARYVYIRKNTGVGSALSLAEVQVLDAQGRNLAQGKSVSSSGAADNTQHKAANAVDGITGGRYAVEGIFCSAAMTEGWLQIDLGSTQQIGQINLHGRQDTWAAQNGNYTVFLGHQDMTQQRSDQLMKNTPTAYFVQTGSPATEVQIKAQSFAGSSGLSAQQAQEVQADKVLARYVYVRKNKGINNNLSLAEVQVLDAQGRNLAQSKSVSSSGSYDNTRHKTANAVDGITGGRYAVEGIFVSATGSEGWLQIDLGSMQEISWINLYGRQDAWTSQNGNYTIYVGSQSMAGKSHELLQKDPQQAYHVQEGNGPVAVQVQATQLFAASTTHEIKAGSASPTAGLGSDTYRISAGAGSITIAEHQGLASAQDRIQWDSSVDNDDLWFSRAGQDLQVSVIGTSDALTIKDWYQGAQHQVELMRSGSGQVLMNNQIDALVSAMASFGPIPSAQQSLAATSPLSPLSLQIASSWQQET